MSNDHSPTRLIKSPSSSFERYVAKGKALAESAELSWDIELDSNGVALPGKAWDLRLLLKDGDPTTAKLRTFSTAPKALIEMAARGLIEMEVEKVSRPVSPAWQDLIKAFALNHLLVVGLSVAHLSSTCTALRLVATVATAKDPWQLDADDLLLSMSVAKTLQPSGQMVTVIGAFVKTVIDAYHLSDACPLAPMIAPGRVAGPGKYRAAKFTKKAESLPDTLLARKSEEKLPEIRAFWELMRIVFTETPRTFLDAIRFSQAKMLAITGLRIGEISLLPLDWKRNIDYRDRDGSPAGEHGGFSRALLLRHFAEKQGSSRRGIGTLWEASQFVPEMFEQILTETLDEAERLTAPLRKTLRQQCESGRVLHMYDPKSLLPVHELYVRMTGMALYSDIPDGNLQPYFERYRSQLDITILDELLEHQLKHPSKPSSALYVFANRLKSDGVAFRNPDGTVWTGRGVTNQLLRIDEVEAYIRNKTPTKVSDLVPFRLDGGKQIQPWEMLFLAPKRALGEGRDNSPCHVGRILGVGLASPEMLANSLTANDTAVPSIFQVYGQTESDRALCLLPHSLRHLQNTELFRLGVADTIITKRFNRRSVAQSYEYDHRSLQEELDQIALPDEWNEYLGPKAGSVAKLIEAGRANGPIVKEFKRLRASDGDPSAYSFLKAEVDGFHATPYGHCLNSFAVDPCPTHLECFNGCGHLSATNLPENRRHLMVLQGKLSDALELARGKPSTSIGRENQIQHAEVRLASVLRILETPAGELVFPNGPDLSTSNTRKSVLHGT
jgi:hypothetical protein